MDIDLSTIITDRKTYITVATEDVWGRDPNIASGSGTGTQGYIHVPVTNYDARFRPERRQAVPKTGLMTKKHGRLYRGLVQGAMACPLYGHVPSGQSTSLAQILLEWALGSTGGATNDEQTKVLPSKTIRVYEEGVANKAHYGMRVNTLTLTGSDDTGSIDATFDLMGKSEAGSIDVEAIPPNHNRLVDFDFQLSTFKLAGVTVPVRGFTLTCGNVLVPAYNGEQNPNILVKTDRTYGLQLQLLKRGTTYEAYARALGMNEFTGQIILKGLHNGTASNTYTQVTIDFDRLQFVDQEPQRGPIYYENLNLEPLKPDTTNRAVRFTWTTV